MLPETHMSFWCYIITFVIIEAVMAAQSSFEFTSVVGGGGGGVCDVIFKITEGVLELICFVLEGGGVLSTFLLDNTSFSAPPSWQLLHSSLKPFLVES